MTHESRKPGRSLRSLDWINFCMADVQMATAAFVAVYLAGVRHWDPGRIGIVIATQNIATMITQPAAGNWIDCSIHKKWLVAGAAAIVGVACLAVVAATTIVSQVSTQIAIGAASGIFVPAIASLSLGLIGRESLAARIARNEAFNHAGKVSLALVAAFMSTRWGPESIFWILALFGAMAAVGSTGIRSEDIDNAAACAADHRAGESVRRSVGISDLLYDSRISVFLICIVLFHFSNAALLQLVGQQLSKGRDGISNIYMSVCIIVAQTTMIPVALLAGRVAQYAGRKPMFLAAYGLVSLRALLLTFTHSSAALIAIQVLDGISSALFGVVWTLIASDLAEGTGRFSLLAGISAAAWYFGAFLSNLLAGFVANAFGFSVAFLGLTVTAGAGFIFLLRFMTETHHGTPSVAHLAGTATSVRGSQQ